MLALYFLGGGMLVNELLSIAEPSKRIGAVLSRRLKGEGHFGEFLIACAASYVNFSCTRQISTTMLMFFAVLIASGVLSAHLVEVDDVKVRVPEPRIDGKATREVVGGGGEVMAVNVGSKTRSRKSSRVLKEYSVKDVAKHVKEGDCWVIVRDRVYDVSGWERKHPGGLLPLLAMAGRDGTDAFEEYHPSYVWQKWLPRYEIGTVKDAENSNIGNRQRGLPIEEDRLAIREKFIADGLYQTRYSYFAKLLVWYALVGTAAVYVTLNAGHNWSHIILGSALMGLFWQQTAFLGHDLGHNGVFHDRQLDGISGVLFSSCAGISIAWWKRSHNVHHIVCNSIEHDPDIQHLPVLAITDKIFKGFWSTYHSKRFDMDAFARFLVKHQHWTYYIIMGVARFNLYAQSWLLLLDFSKSVPHRSVEIGALLTFAGWKLFLMWRIFMASSIYHALAWVLVANFLSGILHVQITLSHFSMKSYEGLPHNDASDSWTKNQLNTTMDVECPSWMDWFHGGLQFQVVHHLFPRLPRHNLRIASEYVRALAEKHGVHYHRVGFMQANRETIQCLWDAAQVARKVDSGDGDFKNSMIYEAMNLSG